MNSRKILIVDDSSLARRSARQMLEDLGHTVQDASDGAQALERYFLDRPDLVLLDMVMTGMYGLDVLAKIRELNPDALVIVVTADIQKSTEDQARAAGAAAFLNKPLNREKLKHAVSAVLEGTFKWN
jgi:two-component system, chemotaxis family, chemotaxis protein CheY